MNSDDAAFISAARTAVPKLVIENERLEDELEDAKKRVETLHTALSELLCAIGGAESLSEVK